MFTQLQSSIQWEMLAPAALLLLVILPVYRGAGGSVDFHKRNAEHPSVRGMARAWQNWIDLARAALGVLLLQNSFVVDAGASVDLIRAVTLTKTAILGLGLVLQVVRFHPGLNIYSPSFYLTGLTPLLSGPIAGGFAALFGWLFVVGTHDPRWLLPLIGVLCGISAYVFGSLDQMTLLNIAMLMCPMAVAFLLRRFPLHLCRGLRPAVPGLTNSLTRPEFRRVQDEPVADSPSQPTRP